MFVSVSIPTEHVPPVLRVTVKVLLEETFSENVSVTLMASGSLYAPFPVDDVTATVGTVVVHFVYHRLRCFYVMRAKGVYSLVFRVPFEGMCSFCRTKRHRIGVPTSAIPTILSATGQTTAVSTHAVITSQCDCRDRYIPPIKAVKGKIRRLGVIGSVLSSVKSVALEESRSVTGSAILMR